MLQTTRMVVDALTSLTPKDNIVVAIKNNSQKEIIKTFNVGHIVDTSEILAKAILDELF